MINRSVRRFEKLANDSPHRPVSLREHPEHYFSQLGGLRTPDNRDVLKRLGSNKSLELDRRNGDNGLATFETIN